MTENKIATDSPHYQFSKNRINSSSSSRPSNSNHGTPWKLGLMRTEWTRKVSRTVITLKNKVVFLQHIILFLWYSLLCRCLKLVLHLLH